MAKQVRGYEGTLLEAIEAGVVPRPERLRYREWLAWRAAEGQRPSRRRGDTSRTTTNGEEAELWREVMRALHEEDPGEASEGSSDSQEEEELLSADDGTGRDRAATGAGRSTEHPDRFALEDGRATPASSTVGNESVFKAPVTAEALEHAMARPYDGNKETAKKCARRVYRIADVLQEMGAEVDMQEVELKVARAIFSEKVQGQTPEEQLASLKEFFRELLLEDPPEEQEGEHEARLEVLLHMIQERGGKLSKTMGKVFSSNEGTPEKSGPSKVLDYTPAGRGRGESSPVGLGHGDGFRSPAIERPAAEVADLKRRVAELEGDARSEASRGVDVSAFAEAIEKQTKVMAEALGKKQKRSTIQVSPKVHWPTLDDECSDYRSVQEFYDSFEATIGLANDGDGMTDMEKLTTLKACLKQHRLKTYELIYRKNLGSGIVKEDPGEVYRQIKSKHLMFSETAEEKEIRVLEEGDALQKGKLSAFQWEVRWESHLADRDSVGLGLNAKEALIQYFRKIGPALSRDVRRDRRFRPDGSGGNVFRAVATWEEAHEVVKEIEETNAGQKALNNSTFAVKQVGKDGKKGADQIHAQGSESLAAKVCYEMRDKGTCSRGKDCKFSHDKAVVDEARRKWVKEKKQQERPSEEPVAKYEGGRKGGKGKGSGRKGADQAGSKGGQDDRKSKACRFFNTAGGCSRGSKCPFSHALQKGSGGPPGKGNSGPHLQLANLPDLRGVDGTGRGMECSNPFGCFEPVVCSGNGRSQATEKVLATDPKAKGKTGKAGKQGKGKGNNNDLTSLDQLPQRWWTESPNCKGGYQYQTEVKVLDRYVGCLLDGCAGCNSITEEVVMGAIRAALQQGIGPDSEKFPVAQLERWPQEEVVMGLANDAPIKLKGAVVMRVQMPDVNGQKVEEILVRAKVIGKGLSTWQGLILGGRALDAVERGGLGFRPAASCHVFDGLGVKLPRKEEMEPFPDRAYPFVSIPKTLFDQAWDPDEEGDEVKMEGEVFVSEEDLVMEPMTGDWIRVVEAAAWISGPECEANGKPQVVLLLAGLMAFLTAGVAAEGAPEAVSKGVTSTWKPAQESVFHIVETPGALDLMAEESPTDEYYHLLRDDMEKRYPEASIHLLDHLEALESFLDRSIIAGMTFGIDKASVAVVEGENISHYNPHVIVAAGQGAVIGLAAASPVVVETVMLSRNIQQGEAHKLATAWAKVKIIAGVNPRISKANPGCELLKEACPEMFKPHPLESIPRLGLLEGEVPRKEEIREFLGAAGVVLVETWDSILWKGWLEKPSKDIWEHGGLCACGRRTRLFGQCMECIAQEHSEDKLARALKEEEECVEEDQGAKREGLIQSFNLKAEIERDEDTGLEKLTKGAEDWLDQRYREREAVAEEARGASGSRLGVGQDLRNAWFKDQRSDPKLLPIIQSCWKKKESRFRIADDGLLERLVHNVDGTGAEKWVPVVPEGEAAHMMTWREFCARQVHAGVMGAHRSGSKMLTLLRRTCWWENMEVDLDKFSDNCLTCIRGRKRPAKQQAVAVKPSWLECWEEVAVDFEGPMHPEDAAGNRFILSYMCCASHSIMLEPCKALTQMEVRRAFSKLMFRSRTIPKVLRSDRGQEFQSTLMREYCAILGLRQKFSAPLRPCELGATERIHQETQKVLGLMVHGVCKARPHEWGELLGVVEFVLDTTPGPSGIAPRDFERGWSIACPLERELLGQSVWEFEPVEEHTKKLFRSYREIRVKVLGRYAASSAKRAERANRFRKVKVVEIGDLVVYRDPRLRSGGRTPWRKQLSEPYRVVAQRGNRVDLESPVEGGVRGGTSSSARRLLRDVHMEDLLLVPPDALEVEAKAACQFETEDSPMAVRSPGMMLEERGRATAAAEGVVPGRANKRTSQGKLASLRVGSLVAYAADSIRANVPDNKHVKRCRVGQVRDIHPGVQQLQVHRYQPFADGRLRVLWKPIYLSAGTKEETFEALGNEPLIETVFLQRVITEVFLNSGVVNHASARRIDASGYRIDERKSPSLVKEMEQLHCAAVQQSWVQAHATLVAVTSPERTLERPENGDGIGGLEGGPELEALLEQKHQEAIERSSVQEQQITEALEACGFRSRGLGAESSPSQQLVGDRKGNKEGDERLLTCGRTLPRSVSMGGEKGKGRGKFKGLWDVWAGQWNVDEVSRRITKLLRHGRDLSEQEKVQQISAAGWSAASFVLRCLNIIPDQTTDELLVRAAKESGGRLETNWTSLGLYVRARHSWSLPHVREGLPLAILEQEPSVLFHGTSRVAWQGILGSGALVSEATLHGGHGRTDVHLVRQPEAIKKGSEVMIWIPTRLLGRIALRAQHPVFANEKAIYFSFPLPVGGMWKVTAVDTKEVVWTNDAMTPSRADTPQSTPRAADQVVAPQASNAGSRAREESPESYEEGESSYDEEDESEAKKKPGESSAEGSEETAGPGTAEATEKGGGERPGPAFPLPTEPKAGLPKVAAADSAGTSAEKDSPLQEDRPRSSQGTAAIRYKAAPACLKATVKQEVLESERPSGAAAAESVTVEKGATKEGSLSHEVVEVKEEPGAAQSAQEESVNEGPGAAHCAQEESTGKGNPSEEIREGGDQVEASSSRKTKELGPSAEQVKKEAEMTVPVGQDGAVVELEQKPDSSPDWGTSSASESSQRSRSTRRKPSPTREASSGQDDADGSARQVVLQARPAEPAMPPEGAAGVRSSTASRRDTVRAHMEMHGSVTCPRCGEENAQWRVKCYKCNLERADAGAVRSEFEAPYHRGHKKRGKKGSARSSHTWRGGWSSDRQGQATASSSEDWRQGSWASQDWQNDAWAPERWQGGEWTSQDWGSGWKRKYDPTSGTDENHPYAHAGQEVAWSGVRVARQTGESAAAIVRALEGAVVAVVEAAGVQAEATVSKVFEWMALILALWAVWALGRWWKHQEMMMAGFSAGKKRGKRNTDAGKKGEPEGQELS
ncbi:unnamed protein product [Durusdinium trenchii]|uniref:Uncharacterized protein n=1 Tax=Durusdinium trenchii TaxID=1381693 RepID=A0ABP0HFG1_9DINO